MLFNVWCESSVRASLKEKGRPPPRSSIDILNAAEAFRPFKSNSFEPPSLRSRLALEKPFQQVDVSRCHESPATWEDPNVPTLPSNQPAPPPHPFRIQQPSPTTATGNYVAEGNPTTSFSSNSPLPIQLQPRPEVVWTALSRTEIWTPVLPVQPLGARLCGGRQPNTATGCPRTRQRSMKNPATAMPHK
jgi:hypothetical protein